VEAPPKLVCLEYLRRILASVQRDFPRPLGAGGEGLGGQGRIALRLMYLGL